MADKNDLILYDTARDYLSYDVDDSDKVGTVQLFATLTGGSILTAGDVLIVA